MRFHVVASDGREVHVEAVDWMMAMVRATELMGTRVSGFSCDTRPGGVVNVTDHETGMGWVLTPVDESGTPLLSPTRGVAPEPKESPGIASRQLMAPRRRRYRTPPRKPLWSPGSSPRRGPAALDAHPPPNLAERLFELSHRIEACADANTACIETLDIVMGLVPGEAGSVLRGGQADAHLVFVAATGPAGEALVGRELPYGQGIAGAALLSGVTIQVNDVAIDPRHLSEIDTETGFSTRAILCVPVRTGSAFFGVIEVLNPPAETGFLAWHIDVVESLAQALARTLSGS